MKAEDDQRLIENVLEQRKTIIGEHTTFDEFEEAVKADERVDKLEKATRRYIFERVSAVPRTAPRGRSDPLACFCSSMLELFGTPRKRNGELKRSFGYKSTTSAMLSRSWIRRSILMLHTMM